MFLRPEMLELQSEGADDEQKIRTRRGVRPNHLKREVLGNKLEDWDKRVL